MSKEWNRKSANAKRVFCLLGFREKCMTHFGTTKYHVSEILHRCIDFCDFDVFQGCFRQIRKLPRKRYVYVKYVHEKMWTACRNFLFARGYYNENSAREPKNGAVILIFVSNLFRLHYFISISTSFYVRSRSGHSFTHSLTLEQQINELNRQESLWNMVFFPRSAKSKWPLYTPVSIKGK